jgi:hypothetical protein
MKVPCSDERTMHKMMHADERRIARRHGRESESLSIELARAYADHSGRPTGCAHAPCATTTPGPHRRRRRRRRRNVRVAVRLTSSFVPGLLHSFLLPPWPAACSVLDIGRRNVRTCVYDLSYSLFPFGDRRPGVSSAAGESYSPQHLHMTW